MMSRRPTGILILVLAAAMMAEGASAEDKPADAPKPAEAAKPSAPQMQTPAPTPGPARARPQGAKPGTQSAAEQERMSYAVGVAFGRSLRQQGMMEFNFDKVVKGMADAYNRLPIDMSEEEYRALYGNFQREAITRMGKQRQKAAYDNKNAGDAFLAENAKKEGVVTLPSGVQYKVVTMGTGEKPTKEDTVTAHYRGSLIDGTEIDTTYTRNEPATFKVRTSIAGWQEALPLMPVGSKWEVYVPGELAYSMQGAGRLIGPNATLVFEIELLAINKS